MTRRLNLDPHLPLPEAVATAFEAMLVEARDRAEKAIDEPHASLHNYRRALRRAEAVIALSAPFLRTRQLEWLATSVDRARRKTRLLRDIDAVVRVIGELESLELAPTDVEPDDDAGDGGDAPVAAAPTNEESTVRSPLRALIEAFRGELATSELIAWRLRKNLRALAGLSSIFRAALVWVEDEALMESMRSSYRDARRAMKRAANKGTAGALHGFRKAARTLRYQLELLASREGASQELTDAAANVATIVAKLGYLTDIFSLRAMVLSTDRETLQTSPRKIARALEHLAEGRTAEIFALADVAFTVRARDYLRPPEAVGQERELADSGDATPEATEICEPGTAVSDDNLAKSDD